MSKSVTFCDQLRDAIENSGMTRYRISKESGVDAAQLCRFANGQGNLSIQSIESLFELLGLEIKAKGRKRVLRPRSERRAKAGRKSS